MAIQERYGKLGEEDDFDVAFWQSQPPEVLFEAASQLIRGYLLLRDSCTDEPKLDRTAETFQKVAIQKARADL